MGKLRWWPSGSSERGGRVRAGYEFGNVLGGDTTDWCFEIAAFPRFGPSYPNPCNSTFTIRYGAAVAETIKIYFLKPNNDSIVVFRGAALAGFNSYIIDVSTYNFTNTFQRLYVQSQNLTTSDSCKNYGDIKFVP